MRLIPGLHLRSGSCMVPMPGGYRDPGEETLEPAARARELERAGASGLHLTDLDGEASGGPRQLLDILDVLMAVAIPVQVAAGMRTATEVGQVLSRGAARAVVQWSIGAGTGMRSLIERFGERLVVRLDEGAAPGLLEQPALLKEWGAASALWVDPERSGTLAGPRLEVVRRLADAGPPLIVAGGIRGTEDLRRLAAIPNLAGVVVGRALAEGLFEMGEGRLAAGDV
jgi:phosphoribosylformimino-5-aminoimidazole carboxamide ribotide isomerase